MDDLPRLSTILLIGALLTACQPTPDEPATAPPSPSEAAPEADDEVAVEAVPEEEPAMADLNEPEVEVEVISPEDVDLRACAAGVNAMAFSLWEVLEDLPANAAISPTSIALAMNMVLAGARGDTAEELAGALGVEAGDEVHRCWGGMLSRWEKAAEAEGLQLDIANRLFGQAGLPFEDDYIGLTGRYYRSPLTSMDLRGDSEGSRLAINQWVEEATRERIQDLLPPRSIDSSTTLVLVNALYLLAKWERAFDESRTRTQTFTLADETISQVQMMQQKARFPYAEVGDVQVLELPYDGGDLSMVVLLPATFDGLAALEDRLDPASLSSHLGRLRETEVEVFLPRFTIEETSVELVEAFRALGVEALFGPADLTGIIQNEPAFISGIYHKTFVQVDEAGTEAAAATAGVATRSAAPPRHPVFRADRPFLFLILDQQTETILFLGRVNDP